MSVPLAPRAAAAVRTPSTTAAGGTSRDVRRSSWTTRRIASAVSMPRSMAVCRSVTGTPYPRWGLATQPRYRLATVELSENVWFSTIVGKMLPGVSVQQGGASNAAPGGLMGAVVQDSFTIGVEEEFLTVDAKSLELRPRADRVLAATRRVLGPAVQTELNLAQIEVATPVCDSLDVLEAQLRRARTVLAAGVATRNSAIAATATHPCAQWVSQVITPADRYLGLEEDYQQLAREQLICGCHVHVGIDDPDRVIRIMDRVRSWVPVLLAFAANSPYWQGVDTGYASYRTQVFDRWPTGGPAPLCGDRAGYERIVSELVEVGMIADETYVYWHVGPSSR